MLAAIRWLQSIDRRVVYVLLVLVFTLPFLFSYTLPIYPDTYTTQFYDELERIAQDPVEREKVVLVLTNWGPGTGGENEPQFQVVIRHLLRRRLPFILVCSIGDPVYHDAAVVALERAKQAEYEYARRHGLPMPTWDYGDVYIDFGYKNAPVFASQARTIITDTRRFFGQDFVQKRDLEQDESFPILRRFRSPNDISAVLTISAGDEGKYIAGLVQSDYPNLKIGVATMGIVANDLYPYVKSGQLFGLLNSQRAATEYRALLNKNEPTSALDNAMSLGKMLLLLVVLGNLAFLVTRWAERTGRLPLLDPRQIKPPLPPLPRWFMVTLLAVVLLVFGATIALETVNHQRDGALPRRYVLRAGDDVSQPLARFERVGPDDLLPEAVGDAAASGNPALAALAEQEAQRRFAKLTEQRVGEFLAAFLTIGVLAFLLGDNRFYRFIEAIIIGSALAYMLDQYDKIIRPDWVAPIARGLTGEASRLNLLWALLAIPGALWYFTYSKKYRWFNQILVALFIGLMIGPEFENQITLMIPQILDTVQPVWPWGPHPVTGATAFLPGRLEHLVFVLVAVLSLTYFILFFRPRTRAGKGVITAGRLVMMVGFGAMFGNTVNTRLSWLAPRIGFLIEDWLGKLLA